MKIKITARTNANGSDCSEEFEIPDEEWTAMSEEEKEEYCKEYLGNLIEWFFEENVD